MSALTDDEEDPLTLDDIVGLEVNVAYTRLKKFDRSFLKKKFAANT